MDDNNINKFIHSKGSYNLFPACKYYIFHAGTTYRYNLFSLKLQIIF